MSCRRAEEMDLLAFAADRAAAEWAEFREHYPSCPECSRAIGELGELVARLAEHGEGVGHLSEDQLLGLEANALVGTEAAAVAGHLEGCAACRSELAVLRSFELPPATLARASEPAAAVADRSRAVDEKGWLAGLADLVASLFQPAPALGFAAVVALAAVVVWTLARSDGDEAPPRYVEQPAPAQAPAPLPESRRIPQGSTAPEAGERLAEGRPSTPLEDSDARALDPVAPAPRPRLREQPQIAESRSDGAADASPPAPDAAGPGSGEGEVMLLAALLPSELPRYALPPDLAGAGALTRRVAGSLRSGDGPRPRVSVLAPEGLGLTRASSPRLYWALDRAIAGPVEIVIDDPTQGEPLLETTVDGPFAVGLHSVDLAALGVTLGEGHDYQWSVAVILDAAARESDVVSSGAIRRLASEPEDATRETEAERAQRVHRLAAAGDWYDAFDQTNRWLAEAPALTRVVAYRRALLEQVTLAPTIAWIEGAAVEPD